MSKYLFSDHVLDSSDPHAGDWPEDIEHENGSYHCYCVACGRTFTGYKRRVICKLCAKAEEAKDMSKKQGDHVHEITEIEMLRMCARAMDLEFTESDGKLTLSTGERYDPFNNDFQAAALAVRFHLKNIEDDVSGDGYRNYWRATLEGAYGTPEAHIRYAIRPTRNAAIVVVIANDLWGRGYAKESGGTST